MASRSNRWGQFSCTPGERVTMCSCIRVGPSSVVAIGPSAVSTVVAMSTSGSYRESLARHSPNEAFHLGLVVVIVLAGADERVDSALGQIDPRQARLVCADVHGTRALRESRASSTPVRSSCLDCRKRRVQAKRKARKYT